MKKRIGSGRRAKDEKNKRVKVCHLVLIDMINENRSKHFQTNKQLLIIKVSDFKPCF